MKPLIEFYRNVGMSFNGDSDGIGGLETQAIELARELSKVGYGVESYIKNTTTGDYDGVKYRPSSEFEGNGDINIGIDVVPYFGKRKSGISWTHAPGLDCYSPNLDYIVCNSKWTLEHYQKHKPSDNYIVIPCGFHFNKHKCGVKKPYSIVMAGSIRKGFNRIPEIFKRVKEVIPEATFDVFGGAELWGEKELKYKHIYKSLKEAGINYHGVVSKKTLWDFYKHSSVYFAPRCDHTETFGLSLIEAMASGCVPVCSAKGNHSYLIKDNGILLPYNDIDEAQILIDLLTNKEKLSKLRINAIESVKRYDWSNVIKLWEEIL